MSKKLNYVSISKTSLQYLNEPNLIFSKLSKGKKNTLLLESAEIKDKNSIHSILFIDTAVRIYCNSNQVHFYALTQNGSYIISALNEYFINLSANNKAYKNIVPIFSKDYFFIDIPSQTKYLDEDAKLKAPSVFDCLRAIQKIYQDSEYPVYLGGYFSYDLVRNFMPLDVVLNDDGIESHDFVFYVPETVVFIDHHEKSTTLFNYSFNESTKFSGLESLNKLVTQINLIKPIFSQDNSINNNQTTIKESLNDKEFMQIVNDIKHYINNGDVFQIVHSRRFSLACKNPFLAYQKLKLTNPSPYMFYMNDIEFNIFGASPESALKYSATTNQVEIYPIAGSRPRGYDANGQINPELDSRLELELRMDEKETVEHLMLVDLGRNDIARVSKPSTRKVVELMQIDRYSHVMHLVSKIVGELKSNLDALHAYCACMNMGTLTGAPKIRAMQLIYELEKTKRHSYGGALGYMTSHGNFDTCILIRSAFVQNDIAHIQAGAGIVFDSDPAAEANETKIKARAVLNAIIASNKES